MNQILLLAPPALPACLADAEIAAALSYVEQEKSEGTRGAYKSDWAIFTAWCGARGLVAMLATPTTTARFLSSQAIGGLKASTIGRRAAAIAYAHKLAGFEPQWHEAMTAGSVSLSLTLVVLSVAGWRRRCSGR
jgi:hypothetical protein